MLAKNLVFSLGVAHKEIWRSSRGLGMGDNTCFWRVNVAVACEFCVDMKRDEHRTRPSDGVHCPKAYY